MRLALLVVALICVITEATEHAHTAECTEQTCQAKPASRPATGPSFEFVETSTTSRVSAKLSNSLGNKVEAEEVNSHHNGAPRRGFFEPQYKPEPEELKQKEDKEDNKPAKLQRVPEFTDESLDDGSSFYYDSEGNPIDQPRGRPVREEDSDQGRSSHRRHHRRHSNKMRDESVEAEEVQTRDNSGKVNAETESLDSDEDQNENTRDADDYAALETESKSGSESHQKHRAYRRHPERKKQTATDKRLNSMETQLRRIEALLLKKRK